MDWEIYYGIVVITQMGPVIKWNEMQVTTGLQHHHTVKSKCI